MKDRVRIPSLRHHKPSGQAVVTIPLPGGKRKDVYLGPWRSTDAKKAYARILGELAVAPMPESVVKRTTALTVNELLAAFWKWASSYYGSVSSERETYRLAIREVRLLYGPTPAKDFGPLGLKAVRNQFVGAGLTRGEVNRRTRKIVRIFRWGASEELIPVAVVTALKTVEGLRAGRTVAPDNPKKSIPTLADVEAVYRHLKPTIIAMIKVQLLTGARPGEICQLRPCDIDRSGPIWKFTPASHKNAHRGQSRVIMLGPRAQAVLMPLTPADANGYYFNPRAYLAARRAERSTPLYESHVRRYAREKRSRPNIAFGETYSTDAYSRAVRRAIASENERRAAMAGKGNYVPLGWHIHQLRHVAAAMIRADFGIENARAVLGHTHSAMTDHYSSSANERLATEVARRAG